MDLSVLQSTQFLAFAMSLAVWSVVQCGKKERRKSSKHKSKRTHGRITAPSSQSASQAAMPQNDPKMINKVEAKKEDIVSEKKEVEEKKGEKIEERVNGEKEDDSIQTSYFVRRGTSGWMQVARVDNSEFSFDLPSDASQTV